MPMITMIRYFKVGLHTEDTSDDITGTFLCGITGFVNLASLLSTYSSTVIISYVTYKIMVK